MAEKTLTIRLDVDSSDAAVASRVAIAELKRIEAAAGKAATAMERGLGGKSAAGQQRAAKDIADAHVKSFSLAGGAAQKFGGLLNNMVLQFAGLGAARQVVVGIANAFEKARERAAEVAKEILATRDSLRELEGITGRKANLATTREMYQFGAATGMTPEQSGDFQAALAGAGEQYKANLGEGEIGAREMADLNLATGRVAVAKKIDPKAMATLAGTIIGTSDWSKFGDQAGENAAAMATNSINIINAGQGDPSLMARQVNQVIAAMVNEDEMKNIFRNASDAAIATSVSAEKNPEQAAVLTRATARALFKYESPVVQAARIGPEDDYFSASEKMAKHLADKAAEGIKVKDYLNAPEAKFGELDAEGILVATGAGVEKGLFAQRREAITGPEAMRAEWTETEADHEGAVALKLQEARRKDAEFKRGLPKARLAPFHEQAVGDLIRDDEIDNSWTNFRDNLGNMSPARLLGLSASSRDSRINTRIAENLSGRFNALDASPGDDISVPPGFEGRSPEGQESYLVKLIDAIEVRGGKPLQEKMVATLESIDGKMAGDGRAKPPLKAPNDSARARAQPGD